MPDIKDDYVALCATVRDLAQLLVASEAARYDAPPGMASSKGQDMEISNPTLDTVLDTRRMALSDELRDLHGFLRTTAHSMRVRKDRLDRALARWEGDSHKAA